MEAFLQAEKWRRSLADIFGEIISLIMGFGYMKVVGCWCVRWIFNLR